MNYLNGGYAMIKHNASQKDLANAYKTNKPVLVYDENQRAHWAVIEETATESVDEETQEPITIYEYSYRLIDEASGSLYRHTVNETNAWISLTIITKSSTPFTKSSLAQWLYTNGYNSMYNRYTACNNSGLATSGVCSSSGTDINYITNNGEQVYQGDGFVDIISEV